jgi:hypothetical protein
MGYAIDIDTGGTFTDGFFVCGHRVESVKVPTTPHDLTVCFLNCIEAGAARFGTQVEDLLYETEVIRFSNTIGTNTTIQRDGMTTHWAARNVYRIACDENTLRLDAAGTEAMRAETRSERLRRAKPYEEFEKEWRKLRLPEQAIRYYGTYPNPSEDTPSEPQGG